MYIFVEIAGLVENKICRNTQYKPVKIVIFLRSFPQFRDMTTPNWKMEK